MLKILKRLNNINGIYIIVKKVKDMMFVQIDMVVIIEKEDIYFWLGF